MKNLILRLFNKLGYNILKIPSIPLYRNAEMMDLHSLDKIHYGCGDVYFKDWLNVDLSVKEKVDYFTAQVDLIKRHPFNDEVFAFGFSEDFLEHLNQSEQIIFLYEVYRTFQKGGVLRLSFPGLEGVLLRHYINSDYQTAILSKQEAYDMWGHIHFFSFEELVLVCKHIGFQDIKKVEFGISEFNELSNLDIRKEQIGLNTYVEITK